MTDRSHVFDSYLRPYGLPAHVKTMAEYEALYRRSVEDPDGFWGDQARRYLSWDKEWDFVLRYDFDEALIEWFGGGILNATVNCLDRHMEGLRDRVAYHWEGCASGESRRVTYGELFSQVNRCAGFLRSRGIGRGDRVVLYMPLVVELPVAMLACARIGAIHCVVFPGFSAASLAYRIADFAPKALFTADCAFLGEETVGLKARVDEAIRLSGDVETVVVYARSGDNLALDGNREVSWTDALSRPDLPEVVTPEPMDARDPLFVLYTSGARGGPKGVVHNHGGYLLYTAMTARVMFDLPETGIILTTGHPGGIASHSYGVYGPLLNGVTSVLFEGSGTQPGSERVWELVAKYKVDRLYTTPTDIRTWARTHADPAAVYDLNSLKVLGCSGEALDPESWEWFYRHVGRERCAIVDAWGQTETGGNGIAPLPGIGPLKAGSCGRPFFGVTPVILDPDTGEETKYPNQEGVLCITRPWPGMACTIYGDHDRYVETYFSRVPGLYFTGDGARKDEAGLFEVSGRIDDVVNPCGFRLGCAEIESALIRHDLVQEAAVVGYPHPIKGQGVYAFVTLEAKTPGSKDLKRELGLFVMNQIGSMAIIDTVQWADQLPKTRSGKVLRRLLQKIAAIDVKDLGDFETMTDPALVEKLIKDRLQLGTKS
ncbi:MAG: acetate--CoA ligase [Thermodesulfobacteriota bacterium]